MALRIFRKSARKNHFLARRPTIPTLITMGDLEPLCEGLSQDNLENVSIFRSDVNMYRAEKGEDAIELGVAMKYLKAARYNSFKALDMYKNYQKYRETYQLDNLKVHREPLCSEIGSKKLEIVGTYDTEGSPLIVFNCSKHEVKHDSKAAMQLLFYTLDQASESEHTQDVGVVVLMDMRDASVTHASYYNNILSVLRDGYPLYVKSIYLIGAPNIIKKHQAFLRFMKQESDKAKHISFSELTEHFDSNQLPLFLGGSYIPGKESTYPHHFLKTTRPMASRNRVHRPEGGGPIRPHSDTSPKHTPYMLRQSPALNGAKKEDSSSKRTVNSLTRVFESKSDDPPSAADRSPNPSNKHTKPLPLPPQNLKQTSPKLRSQTSNHASQTSSAHPLKHTPLLSKGHPSNGPPPPPNKPGPTKPVAFEKPAGHSENKHQFGIQKENNEDTKSELHNKGRVPLKLPNSPKVPVNKKQPLCATSSEPELLSAAYADQTKTNDTTKPSGIASRIRSWQQAADKPKSTGVSATTGSANEKKKPFLKADSEDRLTTSLSVQNEDRGRIRADSDGNKPGKIKKPLVPVKLLSGEDKDHDHTMGDGKLHFRQKPLLPLNASPGCRVRTEKKPSLEYENVDRPSDKEKSSEYENVNLGRQNSHHSHVTPPSPKRYVHDPSHVPTSGYGHSSNESHHGVKRTNSHNTVTQSSEYENVSVHSSNSRLLSPTGQRNQLGSVTTNNGKCSEYEVVNFNAKPSCRVDDDPSSDDETLFGNDGPPGLQEAIYENFGPDAGNRLMSVDDLERHINSKGKDGLSAEYLKIKNEPLCGPYTSCRLKPNLPKNRYRDVVCYEEGRVKLKPIQGKEGSDYIHANYVSGYKKPEAFILTQGPKDKTMCDFWRMVWEKQIHVIVMVTKCVELMKRKCAQYWPESGSSVIHGNVTVEVSQLQTLDCYEQRTLKISSKGVDRTVTHYQFLAWPDYGVPKSGSSVLDLIFVVRDTQAKVLAKHGRDSKHWPSYGPPILVHCSAGVGRSGAFCAIDNAIDELSDKRKLNLQGIVRKMRLQRAYSIQTEEQYEFCYRTLLEYAKSHR